jgi:hypothetical protein
LSGVGAVPGSAGFVVGSFTGAGSTVGDGLIKISILFIFVLQI